MTHTNASAIETSSDDSSLLADLLGELEAGSSDAVNALFDAVDDSAAAESTSNAAGLPEADDAESEVKVKAKKEKKAKAEKPTKEPKVKAEKPEKAPRITSITHKPGARLLALIGGDKSFLTFSLSEPEDIQAEKADQFIADMDARDVIADKVREKAVMFLTWLKADKPVSELNEVLARSFQVLFKDGKLTGGKDGNLQKNLLSKPYSPGTAASQANQMFMLFPLLGITVREKGEMVLNDDSVIATLIKDKIVA